MSREELEAEGPVEELSQEPRGALRGQDEDSSPGDGERKGWEGGAVGRPRDSSSVVREGKEEVNMAVNVEMASTVATALET